jgi:hypothetical protein
VDDVVGVDRRGAEGKGRASGYHLSVGAPTRMHGRGEEKSYTMSIALPEKISHVCALGSGQLHVIRYQKTKGSNKVPKLLKKLHLIRYQLL